MRVEAIEGRGGNREPHYYGGSITLLDVRATEQLDGDAGKTGLFVVRMMQVDAAGFDVSASAPGLALRERSGPQDYLRRG